LRNLLKSKKSKTRKLSELSKTEQNRLAKLNLMLDELKRGKNVQNRGLATWLTEEEYESFESDWESQQQIREELQDKLSELQRYEDKLKEAIMMRNRSDAHHQKGKKSAAYKLDSKCESLCEDALEILQEIVAAHASLQIWFDRNLDFGHGSLIDASLGNLPRLVASRSNEKLNEDSRITGKQSVKLTVVERAIDRIGRDASVPSKGDDFMLEKFLNTDG
jgi:chromosome segregation ATPase